MSYFLKDSERNGTCFYEFQKGNWEEQSYWKADSILIEDVNYDSYIYDAVGPVLENYDHYGVNIVTPEQWDMILKKADAIGGKVKEAIAEADVWVKKTFQEHNSFTILGV